MDTADPTHHAATLRPRRVPEPTDVRRSTRGPMAVPATPSRLVPVGAYGASASNARATIKGSPTARAAASSAAISRPISS